MTGLRETETQKPAPLERTSTCQRCDSLSSTVPFLHVLFFSVNFLLYSLLSASSLEFILEEAGKTRDLSPNCWLLWSSGQDSSSGKLRSCFQYCSLLLAASCHLTAVCVLNEKDIMSSYECLLEEVGTCPLPPPPPPLFRGLVSLRVRVIYWLSVANYIPVIYYLMT